MSDLKLYRGINNIDDDLIEEADCKKSSLYIIVMHLQLPQQRYL